MNQIGGLNVSLAGRPSTTIDVLPAAESLHLPLQSRRFSFTAVGVEEGERVAAGAPLARDPTHHSVPLLAPCAGTVRLDAVEGHITLARLSAPEASSASADATEPSATNARQRLLELGAWQFFSEAHSGDLPDPSAAPRAVIVRTVDLEPFVPRGDALLKDAFPEFLRGLASLQSLLEYQPIHLVIPSVNTELAQRVLDGVRGSAWIKVYKTPLMYPAAHPRLVTRRLGGLAADSEHPVWVTDVTGILALDHVLHTGQPWLTRTLSLAGPAASEPRHVRVMPGYPLKDILGSAYESDTIRVINGGVLTGESLTAGQHGVDTECRALTLLPEHRERELLGFLRPGLDRRSFSRCFLSAIKPPRPEKSTTALRGDVRACVSCQSCERVCPAGITPHLIHRYLYGDRLEDAERLRVDLCIGCGLCSYVCPSKIELRTEFLQAAAILREELAAAEGAKHEATS